MEEADYEPKCRDDFFFTEYHAAGAKLQKAQSQMVPCNVNREYSVDSGASCHTISLDALTKTELITMRRLPNPIIMETANGDTETRDKATSYVKEMDLYVTAVVIQTGTTALLSVGKLAEDHEIFFTWNGGGPWLMKPDGMVVLCGRGLNVRITAAALVTVVNYILFT